VQQESIPDGQFMRELARRRGGSGRAGLVLSFGLESPLAVAMFWKMHGVLAWRFPRWR